MTRQIRLSLIRIMAFTGLLFLGGFFDLLGRTNMQSLAIIYYLLLAVVFVGRISDRIVDRNVRKYLTLCAWMLVLFFLLRGMKYHVFREFDQICRGIWYLYYIPNLLIPTFSLLAALEVDAEGKRRYPNRKIVICISAILLLLVLSNDHHQMVFRFREHFENWDSQYQYGIFYWLLALWSIFLYLDVVYVLVKKCRLSAGKNYFWIPLIPIVLGTLYAVLYFFDMVPKWEGSNIVEFPETFCVCVACFWDCCITIGLIPSNKGYEEVFSHSRTAAQIADESMQILYRSATAADLSSEQKKSMKDIMLDPDTCLHSAKIHGGTVFWQSDLSELNRMNQELEQLEEQLSEEAELIQLQNKMQKERAEIAEKNRVYDEIAACVHMQSQRIADLAKETEQHMEQFRENMDRICCYGTYIKRYANLKLLLENHEESMEQGNRQRVLPGKELELAFIEILRAMALCGTKVSCSGELARKLPADAMIGVFESLEDTLETIGGKINGVSIHLDGNACKAVLEGGFDKKLDGDYIVHMTEKLQRLGVKYQVALEEEIYYLRYFFAGREGRDESIC